MTLRQKVDYRAVCCRQYPSPLLLRPPSPSSSTKADARVSAPVGVAADLLRIVRLEPPNLLLRMKVVGLVKVIHLNGEEP